jgi:hypothetical protein
MGANLTLMTTLTGVASLTSISDGSMYVRPNPRICPEMVARGTQSRYFPNGTSLNSKYPSRRIAPSSTVANRHSGGQHNSLQSDPHILSREDCTCPFSPTAFRMHRNVGGLRRTVLAATTDSKGIGRVRASLATWHTDCNLQ